MKMTSQLIMCICKNRGRDSKSSYGPQVEVAALLADVGRPCVMTTNSTGDRLYFCNYDLGSVINVAKLCEGAYIRD